MQVIELFRAVDGTDFENREKCVAYEAALAMKEEVVKYVEAHSKEDISDRHKSRTVNVILAWEGHKANMDDIGAVLNLHPAGDQSTPEDGDPEVASPEGTEPADTTEGTEPEDTTEGEPLE